MDEQSSKLSLLKPDTGKQAGQNAHTVISVETMIHLAQGTGRQETQMQRQESWLGTEGRGDYQDSDKAGQSKAGRFGNGKSVHRKTLESLASRIAENSLAMGE
ncbi:hypothetical protein LDENG_00082210 [Lucifuga dentata]|nr:hypothetical protein LDENG_00082210 [Lucifuga dentata]